MAQVRPKESVADTRTESAYLLGQPVPAWSLAQVLREHQRLGHCSAPVLISTWQGEGNKALLELPSSVVAAGVRLCTGCPGANLRLAALHLRSPKETPTDVWEMDHLVVSSLTGWGGEREERAVIGDKRYVLGLVNRETGLVFLEPVSSKTGAEQARALVKWHQWVVENELCGPGRHLTVLTDGARELIGRDATSAMAPRGVHIEHHAPDTSTSKGCVERCWRTIRAMGAATFQTWRIPFRFWPAVIVMFAEQLNTRARVSKPGSLGVSPWQAATGSVLRHRHSPGEPVMWKLPGSGHKDLTSAAIGVGVWLSTVTAARGLVLNWHPVSRRFTRIAVVHPVHVRQAPTAYLEEVGLADRLRLFGSSIAAQQERLRLGSGLGPTLRRFDVALADTADARARVLGEAADCVREFWQRGTRCTICYAMFGVACGGHRARHHKTTAIEEAGGAPPPGPLSGAGGVPRARVPRLLQSGVGCDNVPPEEPAAAAAGAGGGALWPPVQPPAPAGGGSGGQVLPASWTQRGIAPNRFAVVQRGTGDKAAVKLGRRVPQTELAEVRATVTDAAPPRSGGGVCELQFATGFTSRNGVEVANRNSINPDRVIRTFELREDGLLPDDVAQEVGILQPAQADAGEVEPPVDDREVEGEDEDEAAFRAAVVTVPTFVTYTRGCEDGPTVEQLRAAEAAQAVAERRGDAGQCRAEYRSQGHACTWCWENLGWKVPSHRERHHEKPKDREVPAFVDRVLSHPPHADRGVRGGEDLSAAAAEARARDTGEREECLRLFRQTAQGCKVCATRHGWVVAGHRSRHHQPEAARQAHAVEAVDWSDRLDPGEAAVEAAERLGEECIDYVEWACSAKPLLAGKTQQPATATEGRGAEFWPAKEKELKKFHDNKALGPAMAPGSWGDSLKVIAMRWVLTWKEKQDEQGVTSRVPKARCVLMGHAGNDDRLTETYAGTPDSSLFRLLLILTVIRSWFIAVADITNAFLQVPLEKDASASFVGARMCGDLPPGVGAKFGYFAGSVHRLLHAVYGLKDAPRLFRLWLHKVLVRLGWSEIDECLYVKSSKPLDPVARKDDRSIADVGSVEVHEAVQTYVDDLIGMGPSPAGLTATLRGEGVDVEDAEVLSEQPRKVVGRAMSIKRGEWVREDQIEYAASIRLDEEGRPKAVSHRDFLAEEPEFVVQSLAAEYRMLLGALGWLATRTRWDLAYAFSALAQFTTTPTEAKRRTLRSVLRLAQEYPRQLQFVAVAQPELRLYVDAAWDEQRCRSRSGFVFQLADHQWTHVEKSNFLVWGTAAEKRFVRSAPGAELLALVKGLLRAPVLLRATRQLYGRSTALRVMTDSATMLDQLRAKKVFKETSLLGRLSFALQELEELGATIEFVPTTAQLADPLTKWIAPAVAWPVVSAAVAK